MYPAVNLFFLVIAFWFKLMSVAKCQSSASTEAYGSSTEQSDIMGQEVNTTDKNPMTLSCIGRSGFYPDPAHLCAIYYLCSPDGSRVSFECPVGKTFSAETQSCRDTLKVSCIEEKASTPSPKKLRAFEEPALNISFTPSVPRAPDLTPQSVGGDDPFISMPSEGRPLYVTASSAPTGGEYFSTTNKVQSRIGAIFSKKLPAQPQLSQSASNPAPVSQRPSGVFNCLGRQGHFPDVSQRCNTYYFCDATGEALKFQCPLDLAFDRREQACVVPSATNCSVSSSSDPVEFGLKQLTVSGNQITSGSYGAPAQSGSQQSYSGQFQTAGQTQQQLPNQGIGISQNFNQGGTGSYGSGGYSGSSGLQSSGYGYGSSSGTSGVQTGGGSYQQTGQTQGTGTGFGGGQTNSRTPQQSGSAVLQGAPSYGNQQQGTGSQANNIQTSNQQSGSSYSSQTYGGTGQPQTSQQQQQSGYGSQNANGNSNLQQGANFPLGNSALSGGNIQQIQQGSSTQQLGGSQTGGSYGTNSAQVGGSAGGQLTSFGQASQVSNQQNQSPYGQQSQNQPGGQQQSQTPLTFNQALGLQPTASGTFPQQQQQQNPNYAVLSAGASGYGGLAPSPQQSASQPQTGQFPNVQQPSAFPQQPSIQAPTPGQASQPGIPGYGSPGSQQSGSLQPGIQTPSQQSIGQQPYGQTPGLGLQSGSQGYGTPTGQQSGSFQPGTQTPSQQAAIQQPFGQTPGLGLQSGSPSYGGSTGQQTGSFQPGIQTPSQQGIGQPISQTPTQAIQQPTQQQTPGQNQNYAVQGPSSGYGAGPSPAVIQSPIQPIIQAQAPTFAPASQQFPQSPQNNQNIPQQQTFTQAPQTYPQQSLTSSPQTSFPVQGGQSGGYASGGNQIQTPQTPQNFPQQVQTPSQQFPQQNPQLLQGSSNTLQQPFNGGQQQPATFPQQNNPGQQQQQQQVPFAVQGPSSGYGASGGGANQQQTIRQPGQQGFSQGTNNQQQSGFGGGGTFGGQFGRDEPPGTLPVGASDDALPAPSPPTEGIAQGDASSTVSSSMDPSLPKKELVQELQNIPQIDASCNGLARGFYAMPGCQQYFYCSTFGERLNYTCQQGLLWNTVKGQCESETKISCSNPMTRAVTPSIMMLTIRFRARKTNESEDQLDDQPGQFNCTGRVGNFPDTLTGCRYFHRCSPSGQAETHQCAGKLLFSVELDHCTDPEGVVCPKNTEATRITTDWALISGEPPNKSLQTRFTCLGLPPGRYANLDEECRSFWICDETGRDKLQKCPAGTVFDNTVQACENATMVDCIKQAVQTLNDVVPSRPTSTVSSAITIPMTVKKEFSCGGKNGFFADVLNGCRTYFYCATDGKHYMFTCPLNYRYSETKEACDAPERTPCESSLSTHPEVKRGLSSANNSGWVEMDGQASHLQPMWHLEPKSRSTINGWIPLAQIPQDDSRQQFGSAARWNSFPANNNHFFAPHQQQSLSGQDLSTVPQVVNGFVVGSSSSGELHFDPTFRQARPEMFTPSPQFHAGLPTSFTNHEARLGRPPQASLPSSSLNTRSAHRSMSDNQLSVQNFIRQQQQRNQDLFPTISFPGSFTPTDSTLSARFATHQNPSAQLTAPFPHLEQLSPSQLSQLEQGLLLAEGQREQISASHFRRNEPSNPRLSDPLFNRQQGEALLHHAQISAQHRSLLNHFHHSTTNRNLLINPTRFPADVQSDFVATSPSITLDIFPSSSTTFSPDLPVVSQTSDCPSGRQGYFPDISMDCRSYIFCDGKGGSTRHACPSGMAFNATLLACDLDIFVACQRAVSTTSRKGQTASVTPGNVGAKACFKRRAGYYADFASGCSDFFYCAPTGSGSFAEKIDYHCPVQFFFDEYRGVCVEHGACTPSHIGRDDLQGAAGTSHHQLTQLGSALAQPRFARQFDQTGSVFTQTLLGRQSEEFRFVCREVGHFADYDSGCVGFWNCEDLSVSAKFVKCPPGMLFDPAQKQCVAAFLVRCLPPDEETLKRSLTVGGKFDCQGKKSSSFYADLAEGCRKFHHCTQEGDTLSYTCPFDWLYNEKVGECVPSDNFTCPPASWSKHSEFSCMGKSGYYSDFDHQCQMFHLCRLNGSRTTMSCPPVMVFDENEAKCIYGSTCIPAVAPSEQLDVSFGTTHVTAQPFECPAGSTGFFGDPLYSCRIYWQCADGVKLQNRTCPGYLRFNATLETCDNPGNVICREPFMLEALFPGLIRGLFSSNPQNPLVSQFRIPLSTFHKSLPVPPTVPLKPDFASLPSGPNCEPGQIGFFADLKSNCRTFYYCGEDFSKRHFACPGHMLFDENLSRCEEDTLAVCSSPKTMRLLGGTQANSLEGSIPIGVCSRGFGVFADVQSGCRNFFTCHANGSLLNQTCPGTLLFNERTLFCDWASDVRCGEPVVHSQNLLAGLPENRITEPFGPSTSMQFPGFGSFPSAAFRPGDQVPDSPFSRNMQISPSELFAQDLLKGIPADVRLKSSAPGLFTAENTADPNKQHPSLRLHLELPIPLPGGSAGSPEPLLPPAPGARQRLFDSYERYHQLRRKWNNLATTTTTTPGPTTTTGIPGMEEGEYEPEEGVLPGAATTPLPGLTTVIAAKPPLAPLIMDATGTAPPLLADAAGRTIPPDPLRSHGVDCYGKKGYFLSPGSACKAYVFCKPTGSIYSFTCPGDYLYNADKEICDWPENVLCLPGSSHTIPKAPARRWRRAAASAENGTESTLTSECHGIIGYFANITDGCLSFYYCTENSTRIDYQCPDPQLRFDERRGVCDWGTRVQCGNESSMAIQTTTSPSTSSAAYAVEVIQESTVPDGGCPATGFYADTGSECRNFYFCAPEGTRLNYTCPENHRYDESKDKCVNDTSLTCQGLKSLSRAAYGKKVRLVTRTRLLTTNGENSIDCRNRRGLYADPRSHCSNFFYCSPQGLKFEYSCPDNMAFNNAVNACDEPSNSSCSPIP